MQSNRIRLLWFGSVLSIREEHPGEVHSEQSMALFASLSLLVSFIPLFAPRYVRVAPGRCSFPHLESDRVTTGLISLFGRDAHVSTCVTSRWFHQLRYKITKNEFQLVSSSPPKSHMASRAFCIPGVLFLLAATVLLIVTSISLPYLPAIDFVRSHVDSGNIGVANAQGSTTSSSISQLRVSGLVFDTSG